MADLLLGGRVDPATHERTGDELRLASSDLTTHGVIVGMTGSGKTGLGIVLIEELLSSGTPVIAIDPKGDLTNLCLTFPALSASEFRPWVDEGVASSAGSDADSFASAQSAAWTEGLASWGKGAADVAALRAAFEATIYTPGSASGVGLDVIGSLAAPPPGSDDESLADEVEAFVGGVLGLVGIDADPLSSREHILLSNLIHGEWSAGRSLDLPALVGMVQRPPIRKLGVFELDQFYPAADRTDLALKLNGLLASPAFAAWMRGSPIDLDAMLRTDDGRPRCAIITTSHLSDEERQFVTTLVLSKLVSWMRRQSGTTELRVLLYMDEVAGYLPPVAAPPTKKPILTLMKQARAFGVGVVLATQNPIDIDYKALSNAGTWMVGRLQTERDQKRLLDGMSSATGGVDLGEVGDTITGLAKREFVIRRAGKDHPEVFTSRWAMSYLRGPLTREQIATLMADQKDAADQAAGATATPDPPAPGDTATSSSSAPGTAPVPAAVDDDGTSAVMPDVAAGVPVRWVDVAAPWLAAVGADPRGIALSAAVVATVDLRYDEVKADLVHDERYELVVHPLGEGALDAAMVIGVDHDERDLLDVAPPGAGAAYVLPGAPIATKGWWTSTSRALVDHLVQHRSLEIPCNSQLRLYGRPGESVESFRARCDAAADTAADAETAALRDRYESKVVRLREQIATVEDRAEVLESQQRGRRSEELLTTAGDILGGLFGGRRSRRGALGSILGRAGSAAGRRSRTSTAGERVEAAERKLQSLHEQLDDLEADLVDEVAAIDAKAAQDAADITTVTIPLEKTDVKVRGLTLAWLPVSPASSGASP